MEIAVILGTGLLLAVVVIAVIKFSKKRRPITEEMHNIGERSEAELTKDVNGPYYFQYFDSEAGEWGFLGMDLRHYEEPTHPLVIKCDNKTVLRERLKELRKAIKNFDKKYEVV